MLERLDYEAVKAVEQQIDTPLSASEETPASVVMPEGAKNKAGGRG
jgi:hypothetical protein